MPINVDRWLLPDGVEEVLPTQARGVEVLRRRLLDVYASWGYELIMPPLLEFTVSLLSGVGRDLDLLTLKVADQLSGCLMGLRADITPQAARIDAHSYIRQGPSRLCYADHVLHMQPQSPAAVRTPLQTGVELFGEAGLDADIEVISLLLDSLDAIHVPHVTLDLGHVGIGRALLESLSLSPAQENAFFECLASKDREAMNHWAEQTVEPLALREAITGLPTLCGDASTLERARACLKSAPEEVFVALDELEAIHRVISDRYPNVTVYFDLAELRGYHYHTGVVFAAYANGAGDAIANGGRYDHIGEAFGRARPATGFSLNLTSVLPLISLPSLPSGIYATPCEASAQWTEIKRLREKGERVVCGLSQAPNFAELACDRELVFSDGEYVVRPIGC